MTHANPTRPDLPTLVASLRLWAVELVVWLVEMLGEGSLTRSLRAWLEGELDRVERGAETLVVMAALKLLPQPLAPSGNKCARHGGAPRGFARVAVRGNDMRRMTRHLFPRQRDLLLRARRLSAFLDALPTHARRLTRRIARYRPFTRLAMIAPAATPCMTLCFTCTVFDDSS